MGTWPLSQLGDGSWSQAVANAASFGQQGSGQPGFSSDCAQESERQADHAFAVGIGNIWVTEPDVDRVAHGVPDRAHRLAALGNAVVPQIPELIGRAILQAMAENNPPPAK